MTVFRVVTDPFPGLSALADLIDPAHPEDLEELIALRNETDDVMRSAAIAAVSHVAPADRYAGPHAAIVMAPFMWLGESRFSAGAFGVLYTASALETAIRESAFHAEALTAASIGTPPAVLPRVALTLDLDTTRHVDYRAIASKRGRRYPAGITAAVYDPDPHRYASAQALGHTCGAAARRASATTAFATPAANVGRRFGPLPFGRFQTSLRTWRSSGTAVGSFPTIS